MVIKISDFRESEIIKSRILKWTLMIPKKIPFVTGDETTGYDETGEINEMDRFPSSSSRRGSEGTTYRSPHSRTYGETSFIEGIDEHTPLIQRENELNDSVDEIRRKFPNADTSKFTSKIGKDGRVIVRLIRDNGKYHPIFKENGEFNEKLPKKIQNSLGDLAEDIVETNREKKNKARGKNRRIKCFT